MALAELKGMKDTGVIGVLKHYPGHGATTADTHTGYASTDATLEEMKENELVPFIEGIRSGAEVIMVLTFPARELPVIRFLHPYQRR